MWSKFAPGLLLLLPAEAPAAAQALSGEPLIECVGIAWAGIVWWAFVMVWRFFFAGMALAILPLAAYLGLWFAGSLSWAQWDMLALSMIALAAFFGLRALRGGVLREWFGCGVCCAFALAVSGGLALGVAFAGGWALWFRSSGNWKTWAAFVLPFLLVAAECWFGEYEFWRAGWRYAPLLAPAMFAGGLLLAAARRGGVRRRMAATGLLFLAAGIPVWMEIGCLMILIPALAMVQLAVFYGKYGRENELL